MVDAINMGSSGRIWAWTIYTEDADGDPLESHTERSYFDPKERKAISLGISCTANWRELKMEFKIP
ncbi:hypothetical protein N9O79_01475 [Luminiphilus sp.]|nr:hypothetical protein [Luminiphilus sp.]